ncbi:hypothetical protein FS837_012094, partial [Tulasnella sp. UAMH 9824]
MDDEHSKLLVARSPKSSASSTGQQPDFSFTEDHSPKTIENDEQARPSEALRSNASTSGSLNDLFKKSMEGAATATATGPLQSHTPIISSP